MAFSKVKDKNILKHIENNNDSHKKSLVVITIVFQVRHQIHPGKYPKSQLILELFSILNKDRKF